MAIKRPLLCQIADRQTRHSCARARIRADATSPLSSNRRRIASRGARPRGAAKRPGPGLRRRRARRALPRSYDRAARIDAIRGTRRLAAAGSPARGIRHLPVADFAGGERGAPARVLRTAPPASTRAIIVAGRHVAGRPRGRAGGGARGTAPWGTRRVPAKAFAFGRIPNADPRHPTRSRRGLGRPASATRPPRSRSQYRPSVRLGDNRRCPPCRRGPSRSRRASHAGRRPAACDAFPAADFAAGEREAPSRVLTPARNRPPAARRRARICSLRVLSPGNMMKPL